MVVRETIANMSEYTFNATLEKVRFQCGLYDKHTVGSILRRHPLYIEVCACSPRLKRYDTFVYYLCQRAASTRLRPQKNLRSAHLRKYCVCL